LPGRASLIERQRNIVVKETKILYKMRVNTGMMLLDMRREKGMHP
jgi:hypothetical protein